MSQDFDAIDKALETKSEIVKESKAISRQIRPEDPEKDYEYSRAQLYNLVEKGQEAVNGILDVCMDTQHPRAYEVAGQLIKHVGDVTDKIVDLQKKMKDLNAEEGPKNVTNNALFVGSTSELQKMIKKGLLNMGMALQSMGDWLQSANERTAQAFATFSPGDFPEEDTYVLQQAPSPDEHFCQLSGTEAIINVARMPTIPPSPVSGPAARIVELCGSVSAACA